MQERVFVCLEYGNMQLEEFAMEEFSMRNHPGRMFIGSFQRQPDPIQEFAGCLPAIQNTYQPLS